MSKGIRLFTSCIRGNYKLNTLSSYLLKDQSCTNDHFILIIFFKKFAQKLFGKQFHVLRKGARLTSAQCVNLIGSNTLGPLQAWGVTRGFLCTELIYPFQYTYASSPRNIKNMHVKLGGNPLLKIDAKESRISTKKKRFSTKINFFACFSRFSDNLHLFLEYLQIIF